VAINKERVQAALDVARRSPAGLRYFFSRLRSPDWLEPLAELGVFRHPVEPIAEGGSIRFPEWPESRYLIRIAHVVPELVRDTILGTPKTDNFTIHEDFIAAALAMCASVGVAIAEREAKWIDSQVRLFGLYPEKAAELAAHLAKNGETKGALLLFRALLNVSTAGHRDPSEHTFSPEPIGKFDSWHYDRILKTAIPAALGAAPKDTFRLVCDLLEKALVIHGQKYEEATRQKEDYSWIWRPEIAHDHLHDQREVLVNGVRDFGLQVSNINRDEHQFSIRELEHREWRIFKRLAVYVLAESANTQSKDVEAILLDKMRYETPDVNPEFTFLLKRWFTKIDTAGRDSVLGIINSGPDLQRLRSRWQQATGENLSDEQLAKRADRWRLSWLHVIADALSGVWSTRYQELLNELGVPSVLPRTSFAWIGPTSPKTPDELKQLTVVELRDFLLHFASTDEWTAPTPEGLSRTLNTVVASDPTKYARDVDVFRGLDPTYLRGVLDGFHSAIKEGQTFEWAGILNLCSWIVEQPREIPGRTLTPDSDPDWGWTRKSIGWLLTDALAADKLPYDQKEKVWQIIAPLTSDPNPVPADEVDYPGRSSFLSMLALNTVRGAALQATVQYGIWVQSHGESALAELAPIVQKHLEFSFDQSYAVREVLGRVFPWLVKLDSEWATKLVPAIFPAEREDHRLVAWQNYLVFTGPYDVVLPILYDQYVWAIDQLGRREGRNAEEADRRLAHHVVIYLWRGKISFADGGLVDNFFQKASDSLRGEAIEFIGRGLIDEPAKQVVPELLGRLRAFWDYRVDITLQAPDDATHELAAFGWWFVSDRFDPNWACNQLLRVLKAAKKVEPDHEVVKKLLAHVDQRPVFALEALEMIVEADRDGWSFYGWSSEAKEILETALKRPEREVYQAAKRVVDLLVAKGYFDFRELITVTR